MDKQLRLLLVEDSEEDAMLLLRQLRHGGYEPMCKRVDTEAAMSAALEQQTWDIVISDYYMPQFSALGALKLLEEKELGLPIIIVSSTVGENTAVAVMKAGAHDFILKSNLARLVPAIERELREAGHRRERKRTEEWIKASLKEKEVLLKEIHHRVKNNLQIISSLLNLQSEYIKDEQDLEMFKVSQNRIESMALIHEKLYQSEDLAQIEFSEYIRDLVASLFCSYELNLDVIELKINVEQIFLNIETAIPCGLIINELVLNSLKHAFPAGKLGEVYINLYENDEKEITLIISDNGIGFSQDFDFRNTRSLGLQLVNALINQLGGTIEFNGSAGAVFKIIFPA